MPAGQNKSRALFLKFWLPVLFWMGFIFFLSSLPGKDVPFFFPYQDIVTHIVNYLLLAYLFSRALKNTYLNIKRLESIFIAVVFGMAYGVLNELHQIFIPGRFASRLDVFIDVIGSLIGGLIYR
jgi:VanZ family protein